jgi:hypothetical protein
MSASRGSDSAPEVLDVKGLAGFLGVSTAWVYQHMEDLPHRRVGNLYRFSRAAVLASLSTKVERTQPLSKAEILAEAERRAIEIVGKNAPGVRSMM